MTTTHTRDTQPQGATAKDLLNAYMELKAAHTPIVWYAASKHVPKGKMLCLPATKLSPEYWIVHTDDEHEFAMKVAAQGCLPKDIREYRGPQ